MLAVVLFDGDPAMLQREYGPPSFTCSDCEGTGTQKFRKGTIVPLKKALEGPEKEIIAATLASVNWNRQKAAKLLDINRTTLFNKMRKYGLLEIKRGGKRREQTA